MKRQTLIQLGLLTVFLIMAIVGKNLFTKYKAKEPNDYLKNISNLEKDSLNSIIIEKDDLNFELKKENQTWKVASKSADLSKINQLVNSLLPTKSPQLLSQTLEKQQIFEIDDDKAGKVILQNNDQQVTFLTGKQIDNGLTVRQLGQNQVYLLPNLSPEINKIDYWYDLDVVDFDALEISQLEFVNKQAFTVKQVEDRKWEFTDGPDNINSDGLNMFCLNLNPLKAQALAFSQTRNYNLTSPDFSLAITDKNGTKQILSFYKGESDYLLKRSSDNEYFIISNSKAESFNRDKDSYILPEEEN